MKIESQKTIFHKIIVFLVLIGLLRLYQSKCSDRPECFKKAVFNYNLPEMNLYKMNGTNEGFTQYSIKAYGDFNSDLYTDLIGVNENREILLFVWNSDKLLYEKVYQAQMIQEFIPKTIYLLDISKDGRLDFVVWGFKALSETQSQNALVSYVRQVGFQPEEISQESNYVFQNTTILKMPETTQPIIIGYKLTSETDGVGFLLFMDGQRLFLTYQERQSDSEFQIIKWSAIAESSDDFSKKTFHHPHWNTLLDLTGDCIPELVILNEDKNIEIWIGDRQKFKFLRYEQIVHSNHNLSGYAFADISINNFIKDYDGGMDFVVVYQKLIKVRLNQRGLTSQEEFCCQDCLNYEIGEAIEISIPQGKTVKQQALHFGDINIDGYPDILIVLTDDTKKTQIPTLFENLFDIGTNSFVPFKDPTYNDVLSIIPQNSTVLSVSFIDILENGILDIVISYNQSGRLQTFMLYNNFLFQNDFYIKGFGLYGPSIELGSQFPGMSFYWINSVNDGFKITYQAQITQTSYGALQMPYTFCGLGRANNYVQSFTVGRNGQKEEWSPIIPNSQLGVFPINQNEETWKIRIFAFPFYEFITVIIVTAIVLSIFGVFLMYFKCKNYKKKQQPLQIQFIN